MFSDKWQMETSINNSGRILGSTYHIKFIYNQLQYLKPLLCSIVPLIQNLQLLGAFLRMMLVIQ